MRCSTGARSTGAGTSLRPIGSVFAIANRPIYIVECGVFNTTDTEVSVVGKRITAAGTPGAGINAMCDDDDRYTPVATPFQTHTADATLANGEAARALLGAAKGAGAVWTWGKNGILISPGTANGFGIVPITGTGQILDWYMIWDE